MADDLRQLARSVGRVGLDLLRAPAAWRTRQWAVVVAVIATTLAAYVEKVPLQAYVESGGGIGVRALALILDACGSGLAVTLLGIATLVAGRWSRRRALYDMALALAAGGLWCWILTKAGQLVLAERRPYLGGAMEYFFALGGHGVSGHAAAAGLLFGPVRDVLARHATPTVRHVVTTALLVWAAVVGWSRVWLGMHFVWNVELGLAIGFFTGLVAAHRGRS